MPISDDELTLNPDGGPPRFIVLAADATVADALGVLPPRRTARAFVYIAVPLAGGAFLLPRWIEVELLALAAGRDIVGERLADLPALLDTIDPSAELDMGGKRFKAAELRRRFAPVVAAEQDDLSLAVARGQRDAHPARRLVVLRSGAVHGLFVSELMSGGGLPADPFARNPAVLGPDGLTVTPPAMTLPDDPAAGESPAEDRRTINGWLEGPQSPTERGAQWRVLPTDEPLLVGQPYELKFDIDVQRAESLVTGGAVAALAAAMQEGETLEMLVEVVADKTEFDLYGRKNATISMPKRGPSLNRVTFSLTPKQTGQRTIKALFYANNELFQEFSLALSVTDKPEQARPGAQPGAQLVQKTGIDVASAFSMRRALDKDRITLVIVRQTTGYEFILQGPVVKRATVKIEPQTILDNLRNIRDDFLSQIVMRKDAENQSFWPYLEPDTTIDEAEHQASLKILARAGRRLYRNVFEDGEGGADAQEMGELIREVSRENELCIQVVADRFNFPWALFYDREEIDPPVEEGFWGFKHIVQYMPEFRRGGVVSFSQKLRGENGRLPMAFVFDAGIDAQFRTDVVQKQRAFIGGLGTVAAREVQSKGELFALLGGTEAPPLIYFYSHAESMLPGEQGKAGVRAGVDASYVTITDGGKVTLEELKDEAPIGRPKLASAPFVFLNACQGAELSPEQYAGLLPYFIARGARGALGTEVNTPVHFGAEFATKFIEAFASGEKPVGEVLLDLRKWYLKERRNVMGLVYALHSSGDLIVERGA
jgi:hypothetical protein